LNYLDLFSGIGGFALGAQRAGFHFDYHFNSDISEYANKVYAKRFPEAIQLGDIAKIKTEDLPNGEWIITGGFPCQDISCAGKKQGLDGERSGLWFEMWRLVRDLRPKFLFGENVGALSIRGLDRILGSLAEIGYNAEWQDIRASDVGAPHRRERIWIIAYPASERWGYSGETEDSSDISDSDQEVWKVGFKALRGTRYDSWTPAPAGAFRMDDGLPDRLDRLKCLGNAIVPQISELLFSRMKFLLEREPRKAS
jgi:DNA (cytosine-5)-methyltransferase 1